MKVSVVMATYNGKRYIVEQIESIFNQTRKPDEVLIYDDGSTDGTCEIVEEFIEKNGLQGAWKLIKNMTNKGVTLNFLDGAEEASGDIIFYSDQDDVWADTKIEQMQKGFEDHADMQACYCLRHFINADGSEISLRYEFMNNVKVRTDGFQKVSINEAVRFNKSPGLCLAIKKELIQETRKMILENHLTHDLPIGTVAAIHNGYYVLNKRLVYYRQHGNNVSSSRYSVESRMSRIDKQIEGRQMRLDQMMAIKHIYAASMKTSDLRNLNMAIQSTKKSIEDLKKRNLFRLFLSIFNTNPMMNNWIAVNNLLISLRNNV